MSWWTSWGTRARRQLDGVDRAAQAVTVRVTATIGLTIRPAAQGTGEVGGPYSLTPTVSAGGTAPYTWSLVSGRLPAGLTLDSRTGVISGTPTAAGSGALTLQVMDANGATAAASTAYALKPDGTVWAWGTGTNGQLGDGTLNSSAVPVRAGVTGVTAITATALAAYALDSSGRVWAWGINLGNLGDGNSPGTLSTPTPVVAALVPPLTALFAQPGTGGYGIGTA